MTAKRRKGRPARRTGGKSALLEYCVRILHAFAFHEYASQREFDRAQVVPEKYFIRNYWTESIYGTRSRKEALISAPDGRGLFLPNSFGRVEIIVEAKWQEAQGSVDEKPPFIWESFLVSKVENWIVVFDGHHWKTPRGKAAVAWLTSRAGISGAFSHDDRRMYVVDGKEFGHLVTKAWRPE